MANSVRPGLYATDLVPHKKDVFKHAAGSAWQFDAKLHVLRIVQLLHESTHALVKAYMPADVVGAG